MKFDEIVQQFQHNIFGKLTMIRSKEKIWFLGAEIQELLGCSNITQVIKNAKINNDEKFVFKKLLHPKFFNELTRFSLSDYGKNSSSITLISKEGVIKLIANSGKLINKTELLEAFDIKNPIIIKTRNEICFGLILKDFCKNLSIKLKHLYNIDKYQIDFYFPDYKLGIEFDETYHKSFNQKNKDIVRENNIYIISGIKIIRIKEELSEIGNIFSELTKQYIKINEK